MKIRRMSGLLVCLNVFLCLNALAADKLVLDLDLDQDLLSLSHNVDGFLFPVTRNYAESDEQVINDISVHDVLKNHLIASALVRIDGKVVGMATEQELIYVDHDSGRPLANSMWLIRLNEPGLQGFLVVNQIEDAYDVFSMAEKVMQSPDQSWKDEMLLFLSTSGETRVQAAYGDLAAYQGGVFEEYNGLNPSDYARLNRFRARIQFVIYPKE
jgi:hypothetical protein